MSGSDPRDYWLPGPGGRPEGPYTLEDLTQRIADGSVTSETLIHVAGGTSWVAAAALPELADALGAPPPSGPDDEPAYYYQSGTAQLGPFSGDEIRQFLNDGRLTAESPITWQGQGWVPAAQLPSRAPAAAESAAPAVSAAAALSARVSPARPAARGSGNALAPRPGYSPGATPTAPGFYLRFAHTAADLARLLDRAEHWRDAARGARVRARLLSLAVLAVVGVGAPILDERLGFGTRTFSFLTPFCVLGVPLVLAATRQGPGGGARRAWETIRHVGCFAVFLVPFVAIPLVAVTDGDWSRIGRWLGWAALGVGGVAVLRSLFRRGATTDDRERLEACRDVVQALAQDAAPGKPVTGWIDLTGPEQPAKLVREGKALSGAPVEVYRDEWFRLDLPLRDGNRLRLAATERRKVKRGFWRKRRKSKWKPGATGSLSSIEVRLRLNPKAYRARPSPGGGAAFGALRLAALDRSDDALTAVIATSQSRFAAGDLLGALGFLYRQLQPADEERPEAGGAPPPGASS